MKAPWTGLSNGEAFLFTLHHNEGITFQRNGSESIPLGQPEYGSSAKNTRGALYGSYYLNETNRRSFKLRFGIGAIQGDWSRPSHGTESWSWSCDGAAFEPRLPLAQEAKRKQSAASTVRKTLRMAFICQQCKQPLQVRFILRARSVFLSQRGHLARCFSGGSYSLRVRHDRWLFATQTQHSTLARV
jgi:hypothetical protein